MTTTKMMRRLSLAAAACVTAGALSVGMAAAQSCDGASIRSGGSSAPQSQSKFDTALGNVARLQYPRASNTCLSGGSVASRYVSGRYYVSNRNLIFNIPKRSGWGSKDLRMELRGNTFGVTSSSRASYRTLRIKFKAPQMNDSDHSDRFSVGQLFAENYGEDAAKLTVNNGRLEINYNDGASKRDLGAAPRSGFKEVTMTFRRNRSGSTRSNAIVVRYDGKTFNIPLSRKYYNSTSDRLYFKTGCYLQDKDNKKCRVEMSSIRLDD